MNQVSSPLSSPQLNQSSNNLPAAPKAWQLVWRDILQGFKQWDVWLILGWQDIRLRYRRSTLGPFWITLSMGVTIFGMAFLYGYLFKMDTRAYFPYLASGMIAWSFLSILITDGTQIFLESASYLKQVKLPFTVFVLRVIVRNAIVFGHNLVIMIPVMLYFHVAPTWDLLFLIPGFLLIFLTAFFYMFILAILGARFRDVSQIITSVVQVIFFITPIIWSASLLNGNHEYIVTFNPFVYFLELLRAPLLGSLPPLNALIVCSSVILVGVLLFFALMVRVRKRIIYWL
jgi:ABC-type polysaccharide/polyol phosphate export permease